MSDTAAPPMPAAWRPSFDAGRPFVHAAFDYLVIAGGLSVPIVAWLKLGGSSSLTPLLQYHLWTVLLLCNCAHFAASTVRLYTKPGSFGSLPFLTMGLPLASIAVLTLAVSFPAQLGRHLQSLYLTWSPFHYSAQAYGLSVMYCYRSGRAWSDTDKRLIRLACFLPFFYAFAAGSGSGVEWFLPPSLLTDPAVAPIRRTAVWLLGGASFLMPAFVFVRHQASTRPPLPLISLLVIVSNGLWLVSLSYMDAFVWATVFHGLQYLAIVTIFHEKESLSRPGNTEPGWQHALRFYLMCLGLGYFLFEAWPHAYALVGFAFAESLTLVVATINVHHFIVDAFIWRLRKDPNYAVVTSAAA